MTWVIQPDASREPLTSRNTPKINLSRKLGLEILDYYGRAVMLRPSAGAPGPGQLLAAPRRTIAQ